MSRVLCSYPNCHHYVSKVGKLCHRHYEAVEWPEKDEPVKKLRGVGKYDHTQEDDEPYDVDVQCDADKLKQTCSALIFTDYQDSYCYHGLRNKWIIGTNISSAYPLKYTRIVGEITEWLRTLKKHDADAALLALLRDYPTIHAAVNSHYTWS